QPFMRQSFYTSVLAGVLLLVGIAVVGDPVLAASGDKIADRVLGQASPNFDGIDIIARNGLASPNDVAVFRGVSPNQVYVADTVNNRVLGWNDAASFANGAPADVVLGQPDFAHKDCLVVSASSLCGPQGVTADSS